MAGEGIGSLHVGLLGPLRVIIDDDVIDVVGPKRRAVLAMLAAAEGHVVPVGELLDALWPADLPESGRQALQNHVSRLRGQLGAAAHRLETLPSGYRLVLARDELDVTQARAALESARANPAEAFAVLRVADDLWRGPVLTDLLDVGPIATAATGYELLRRDIGDELVAAGIAAGRASDVLSRAAASAAAEPLREPTAILHMRALAATGDVPAALEAARAFRRRLVDDTGLDPSPALREAEHEIISAAAGSVEPQPRPQVRTHPRLIGRAAQVNSLQTLLGRERLVSIVGPGGIGKTSVAREIVAHRTDAAVLLLASVTDPASIPYALAEALNVKVERGDVLSACLAVLGQQPALLVVDNCEHLLDPVRDVVSRVLETCPETTVLTTSREALGLPVEYVVRLAPLSLPRPDEDPTGAPSVQLFIERAQRVRRGATPTSGQARTIADIVARLDGMPLAIELAAGRLSSFSLDDLSARLDRSLDLLGGGRPTVDARHRTLRATVAWSYDLLGENERALFRQLSVFPDGVSLQTAEQLAGDLNLSAGADEVLARLVETSMLEVSFDGPTRYRMLETLRAYGIDRLDAANELGPATERLRHWAVEQCRTIGRLIASDQESVGDQMVRRELANLRAAWQSVRNTSVIDDAAAMVCPLYDAIAYRDLMELRQWTLELADDPALAGHPRAGVVLAAAAETTYHQGDFARAARLAESALAAADGVDKWVALAVLSVVDLARGAWDACIEHALAASALIGGRDLLGIAALARAYSGDLAGAKRLNERGAAQAVAPSMRSWAAYVDGEIAGCAGDGDAAQAHYLVAIDLAEQCGATFLVGVASVGLQSARAASGRTDEALRGYRDVIDYFTRTGNWTHLWTTLRNLAGLLRDLGDATTASLLSDAADAAPDAPTVAGAEQRTTLPKTGSPQEVTDRTEVLRAARESIDRHLRHS
ncbi:BTAD domain-containing putative transcriptional regulator [Gordonia sp. PKS22-38]|uniref:BTAD domain-containing putative transcriptional regulator n=1 Tax=Gordonia prachuapensis TaxID=3115651 RepID=A0ABU7MVX4_9ACTN|nr:BTAD domain-containing putative transcriptional regulator [Gordonia sp. PKS22-38]